MVSRFYTLCGCSLESGQWAGVRVATWWASDCHGQCDAHQVVPLGWKSAQFTVQQSPSSHIYLSATEKQLLQPSADSAVQSDCYPCQTISMPLEWSECCYCHCMTCLLPFSFSTSLKMSISAIDTFSTAGQSAGKVEVKCLPVSMPLTALAFPVPGSLPLKSISVNMKGPPLAESIMSVRQAFISIY